MERISVLEKVKATVNGNRKKTQPKTADPAEQDNQLVARLMTQIKEASGLSNSKLATALHPYIEVTDKMVSQYLAGNKPMGESRMFLVAKAAKALGWETGAVKDILLWEELFPKQIRDEVSNDLKKLSKSDLRARQGALAQFEKSVRNLVELGWSDTDIVGITIALTEKFIPYEELGRGGIINPSQLHAQLGDTNSNRYPNAAWLTWKILGLDEASEYLEMEANMRDVRNQKVATQPVTSQPELILQEKQSKSSTKEVSKAASSLKTRERKRPE